MAELVGLKSILASELLIESVVADLRNLLDEGHSPERLVNISYLSSLATETMDRSDYCELLAVALWVLAKRGEPAADE